MSREEKEAEAASEYCRWMGGQGTCEGICKRRRRIRFRFGISDVGVAVVVVGDGEGMRLIRIVSFRLC
jgi:hypothetical protein